MTPLFPKDNLPITINQGQTGNCYLLSSLDCIFNQDGGRHYIKSLFTQNADGSVTLRLKRTEQSKKLKKDKLAGKYTYSLDEATNEDVFIISKQRLAEIDNDVIGAQTNSLAVKILEHISSYYFTGEWEPINKEHSILAHNDVAKRFRESDTDFVGNLLGVNHYDCHNIDEIIQLKALYPEIPVYIGIDWGKADDKGLIHGRHAFRIKDCYKASDQKNYKFTLVNPWDNQKVEEHSGADIRPYTFCVFSMDNALPLILKTKIYQKIPYIFSLYKTLSPEGKELIFKLLSDAKNDKNTFLISFFKNFAYFHFIKDVLEQDKQPDDVIAIMNALASEAKSRKNLSAVFNQPEFFPLLVKTAIQHKATQLKNQAQAEYDVKTGLKNYYFDNNKSDALTRNAGLRQFFENKICSNKQIADMIPADELLASAIIRLFNGHHNATVNELIKTANVSAITEVLVDNILSGVTNKKTRSLLEALKTLEELNPKLGQALFPLICNKLNKFSFNPAFSDMIQQIRSEKESPFKTWVLKKQIPLLSEKELIAKCVRLIEALVIQFNDKNTNDDVRLHKIRLIDNLNRITQENHPHTFGFPTLTYPEITLAVTKKNGEISQAAELQKLQIQRAEQIRVQKIIAAKRVMDSFADQLKSYSATFVNLHTSQQVEAHLQKRLTNLENLFSQPHIQDAYQVLGMTEWPPKLILPFKQKSVELHAAAKRQNDSLANATAVIANYLRLIKEFPLDFNSNQDTTVEQIAAKKDALKTQLGDIIKSKPDLMNAFKTLGLISTQPDEIQELKNKGDILNVQKPRLDIEVLSAVRAKRKQIDHTADRLINKIRRNQQILERIEFDKRLDQLNEMRDNLGKKTKNYDASKMDTYKDDSYEKAFGTANALYDALTAAKNNFLNPHQRETILTFKESCLESIKTALPILETHRGWKQFFANILNSLLSLVGCADPRLFKTQTNSGKITKELEDVLNNLQNPLVSAPCDQR